MSQEQQEQVLQNSEPQSVDVTVNVGGDSRAERFLGTFDEIARLSLDIDRNYGNKRVLTDFPLVNDGAKWTGTINKLIVGFDYTITGHAYKCTDCPEPQPELDQENLESDGGGGSNSFWQSFTPAKSGKLSKIDFSVGTGALENGEIVDNLATIEIFEGQGDTGSLLSTGTLMLLADGDQWREYTVPSTVNVAQDVEYTFKVTIVQKGVGWTNYKFDGTDVYQRGRSQHDGGLNDHVFKTYVTPLNITINETNTLLEIFRGSTQHTVTEGNNSLNLRLSPLLDDRELTVPRITRINRPFQMVASTSDNITVVVDTVKKDGSSAVDATLSYRFRSVDNDSLPLDVTKGGSFSPDSGDVTKSGSSYPDISTTYTAPDNDSTMKLQVRVSNELEIGVTSHFNVYVTDDIETENTVDTNPVITNLSGERIDSNRLKWTVHVSDDEAFSSLDVKWEYLFGDNRTFTEIDPTEYDANSGKMQAIMEDYSDSDDGMLLVTVCETDVSGYSSCAYQNEGSTSMQFELIPNAFQAPIICDGSECSNVPAWFDGDYIACETTSGLPQRITMSLQSGVGSQTIEYLDQVSGNCEGNVVAKIEIKSHYTSDNNSSISLGSDNITVTKATNTIDSTKMTFYNLNYVSAFQMDNASNLCGNSYWAGITHEVSGWCELKGGAYLPGAGATNKAIYSVLDNGTMLGQFSHQTHPLLLDTQGYPTTIHCTGGFRPQADGVFTDMGCPLPFKPNSKTELQTAVDLWVNDKQSAIMSYGDISGWDTSLITDMSQLFKKLSFNDNINNWDVSNVTNMSYMFNDADVFNGDISSWDVSSVENMSYMFKDADVFNGDISSWDVSSLTNMRSMLSKTYNFNQDISGWDVSNVTNMHAVFHQSSFNKDISDWDVSSVTIMSSMFNGSKSFNWDISSWDVSNVTTMENMFGWNSVFNGDISSWDVSNVTNMKWMFWTATSFNQDISGWDVSNVTNMTDMFDSTNALAETNKCLIYNAFHLHNKWANSGATNWDQSCN